jgi:tRNA G18 (ribose-2'-O)-methylase SpoU
MSKNQGFYVVCDNIRSAENVGSIFRTSDALGVDKVFLGGISAKPDHPKLVKTALGAEKNIDWNHCWQTWRIIEKLNQEGVSVVALEQSKTARLLNLKPLVYNKFKPNFPLALIVGNEIKGVSAGVLKRCGEVIYLPMYGKKESLNVAVAFGVAGYYLRMSNVKAQMSN